MNLRKQECEELIEILGEYQNELESAIDNMLPVDEHDEIDVEGLCECRQKNRRVEEWVKKLEEGK